MVIWSDGCGLKCSHQVCIIRCKGQEGGRVGDQGHDLVGDDRCGPARFNIPLNQIPILGNRNWKTNQKFIEVTKLQPYNRHKYRCSLLLHVIFSITMYCFSQLEITDNRPEIVVNLKNLEWLLWSLEVLNFFGI